MSGFKNFILKGNLVDLAVAVVIATAFGKVVEAFVAWFTSLIPGIDKMLEDGSKFVDFLNAVIGFVILAAVVYFFVVVPYTKAREKFFPEEVDGPSETALLTEIRDLLGNK